MTETPKPPTLREAYATRQPSEAEQQLSAQHQPGYIPPKWEPWVVEQRLKMLPANDPRALLLKARIINHQEVSDDDLKAIFGPIQPAS